MKSWTARSEREDSLAKKMEGNFQLDVMVACRWADDHPDTWETEDHLPQHLIAQWEEQQKQRLLQSMQTMSKVQNGKHSTSSRAPEAKPSDATKQKAVQPA